MAAAHFDVHVSPPDAGPSAVELLLQMGRSYQVDPTDARAFLSGQRIRLKKGISEDTALKIVAELQAIGVHVELVGNRPPEDEMVGIDDFSVAAPAPEPAAVASADVNPFLAGGLMEL